MRTRIARGAAGVIVTTTLVFVNACNSESRQEDSPPLIQMPGESQAERSAPTELGTPQGAEVVELGQWRGHSSRGSLTFEPIDDRAMALGIRPQNFQVVPSDNATTKKVKVSTIESYVRNDVCDDTWHNPAIGYYTNNTATPLLADGTACSDKNLCATVRLQNLSSRTYDNLYVEITSMTPSGFKGANSVASANAPTDLGVSNALGLWTYTTGPGNNTPAVGLAPNATKDVRWNFTLPDCRDFYFAFRVVGTLRPTGYDVAQGSLSDANPFLNACATDGHSTVLVNAAVGADSGPLPVPFPFTIYDRTFNSSNAANFRIHSAGLVGFSPNSKNGNNGSLGANAADHSLVPFWDRLKPRGDGVCYVTTGSAPSRKMIITWSNAGIDAMGHDNDEEHMTFSVVMAETTDSVEFQYNQWSRNQNAGPNCLTTTRSRGDSSTVGIKGIAPNFVETSINTAFLGTDGCPTFGQFIRYAPKVASNQF
jgi:hypothetical protein